jgi:hypothetical protein
MVLSKKRGSGRGALARARASGFRGPVADILISAVEAMGFVHGLLERIKRTPEVKYAPNAVKYLERAARDISSAASIIGCGTPKPVRNRRAAR